MHINIQSLPAKYDRLQLFLAQIQSQNCKIDIILICETWLNKLNYNLYEIKGYRLFENHRSNFSGGGVGIYISKEYNAKIRQDLQIFKEKSFESIILELKFRTAI